MVEDGAQAQRRYWQLPAGSIDDAPTEREWVERVRARLEESVRMQMVSDVPIGAFLSGGIDSSGVVALMARAQRPAGQDLLDRLRGRRGRALLQRAAVSRAAVASCSAPTTTRSSCSPTWSALLPQLLWHMDEPIADSAFITTYLVSEFARRDVTVILSGVGGDELFGGYRRYLGDHYHALLRAAARTGCGAARRGGRASCRATGIRRCSTLSRLAKGFLASAELPFEERYRATCRCSRQRRRRRCCCARTAPRAAMRIGARLRARRRRAIALNRMLAVDAETQLPDDLLLLTDKMTMATSLECRVPLLDHELVELAARDAAGRSRSAAGGSST